MIEQISLTLSYTLDGELWLDALLYSKEKILMIDKSSANFRFSNRDTNSILPRPILAVHIKLQSIILIRYSCIQFEFFGCQIDAASDLSCVNEVEIKSLTNYKSFDGELTNLYLKRNSMLETSKFVSHWIPNVLTLSTCRLSLPLTLPYR